jgi:uncharacterized protein (DUF488 family)
MPKSVPHEDPAIVWTIGHSTRTWVEFLGLLTEYRIEAVADVRRFPGSRRYPYFGRDVLADTVPAQDIAYQWLPKLGGRRKARSDSLNTGWRSAAFRGYADHLASAEFHDGLKELLTLASHRRTTLMCAESVWWRCHRALIANVLTVRGIEVVHILDAKHVVEHPMTPPARVVQGKLIYALEQE